MARPGDAPFYTRHGRRYVRVTTAINAGWPKEYLVPWAAKLTAETAVYETAWRDLPQAEAVDYLKRQAMQKRDAAGEHGTAVHEAAEAIAKELPFTVRAEMAPHMQALWDWHRMYRPRVLHSEVTVYHHDPDYAGTFDLLAEVDARTLLIDYKTSKVGGLDWRLQLAAYRFADFFVDEFDLQRDLPRIDGAAVLWIPREEPTNWMFVEIDAADAEYERFLACVRMYEWKKAAEAAGRGSQVPWGRALLLPEEVA